MILDIVLLETVFSLPIRDGNVLEIERYCWGELVFSLPIRDGNRVATSTTQTTRVVFSLPIRDGNLLSQAGRGSSYLFLVFL